MALAFFIATIFACQKKDDVINGNQTSLNKTMSGTENPYNYCGELHNEILYNFAVENNLSETNFEDVHYFVSSYEDSLFSFSDITLTEAKLQDSIIREETINWTNGNLAELSFPDQYSQHAWIFVERLFILFDNAVYAEEELTPGEFASNINQQIVSDLLSDENVDIRSLSELIDNNFDLNEYERIMMASALAKYSYEFWYNAFYEVDHPWHDHLHSQLAYFLDTGKEPEPWWRRLWEGTKTVGYYAGKVVAAPAIDAFAVVTYCWEHQQPSWPIGHGTRSSIAFVR